MPAEVLDINNKLWEKRFHAILDTVPKMRWFWCRVKAIELFFDEDGEAMGKCMDDAFKRSECLKSGTPWELIEAMEEIVREQIAEADDGG